MQELCAGGDLKSLLDANGCVSEVEAATIMRGVLDMLVELHRCAGWLGLRQSMNVRCCALEY